jgi:hypothetical protein
MANTSTAKGFECIGSLGGVMPTPRRYYIPSTDGTAVFVGSPVKLAGSADADGIAPTVALATTSDKPVGVVVAVDQQTGVSDANFSLYRKHRPASVGMYVWVVDDPRAIFRIKCDDVGATVAAVDVGLNCDFTAESGDTVSGLSTIYFDSSNKATTSTLPLKLLRLDSRRSNQIGVANQDVIVMFNKHAYATGYDTGASAEIGGLGV